MHIFIAHAALLAAVLYGVFAVGVVLVPLLRARLAPRSTGKVDDLAGADNPITIARLAAAQYPLHTCNTRTF
jgi:hypothetical protein